MRSSSDELKLMKVHCSAIFFPCCFSYIGLSCNHLYLNTTYFSSKVSYQGLCYKPNQLQN